MPSGSVDANRRCEVAKSWRVGVRRLVRNMFAGSLKLMMMSKGVSSGVGRDYEFAGFSE